MSVKRIMMALTKLTDAGHIENVTLEDVIAHDVSGHLKRLPEDKLQYLMSIGATKSGWGYTPRTRSYSKY